MQWVTVIGGLISVSTPAVPPAWRHLWLAAAIICTSLHPPAAMPAGLMAQVRGMFMVMFPLRLPLLAWRMQGREEAVCHCKGRTAGAGHFLCGGGSH